MIGRLKPLQIQLLANSRNPTYAGLYPPKLCLHGNASSKFWELFTSSEWPTFAQLRSQSLLITEVMPAEIMSQLAPAKDSSSWAQQESLEPHRLGLSLSVAAIGLGRSHFCPGSVFLRYNRKLLFMMSSG
jgi:hypothetical protein